ncbi:DUF3422 domain-containing protein [soil metagenome]
MLPPDHPQRIVLNDEVHARPPEALRSPCRLFYLALLSPPERRDEDWRAVEALCKTFGVAPPLPSANHFSADFGSFRLVFERHAEFARYMIVTPAGDDSIPFAEPAIAAVPADWLAALPGEVIAATQVALVRGSEPISHEETAARSFSGNQLIGSTIGGGAAVALTDLRVHDDGFGRRLVEDHGLTPRQAGRMVQRLLEIDTYRMMALLALPVAHKAMPFVAQCEKELTEVAVALVGAGEQDEPGLLDRLTALEGAIASRSSETYFRFSAAAAYYELVQRRIAELREERLQGLQTFGDFIERRLAPAMNTCRSVGARQELLSSRVARATQLLSTRVDVTRERQNQAVLRSMDRRAALQLRLQTTVEGLSVAAITYYVVGLIGYAAKAATSLGIAVNAEIAMGVSIPIVAALMAFGVHGIRKRVVQPRGTARREDKLHD